jgi:hypothetical protein
MTIGSGGNSPSAHPALAVNQRVNLAITAAKKIQRDSRPIERKKGNSTAF